VGSLLLSHARHFEHVRWPSTSKKASRICTFPVSRSKGMLLLLLRCFCCNLLPAASFFFISSFFSFPYTHTIKMALRLLLSKQTRGMSRKKREMSVWAHWWPPYKVSARSLSLLYFSSLRTKTVQWRNVKIRRDLDDTLKVLLSSFLHSFKPRLNNKAVTITKSLPVALRNDIVPRRRRSSK